MADAFYPDGTKIPEADLGRAIASGEARWERGTTVSMKDPAGQRYNVPAEEALTHIHKGFLPESKQEEEYNDFKAKQTLADEVRTGIAGYLSGSTFGGFDAALRAISPKQAEIEGKAAQVNPIARGVGEVAPIVGSVAGDIAVTAFTGGAAAPVLARDVGAVARMAGAAGRYAEMAIPGAGSIARSATREAIFGAAQGGGYGFGRELSRQSLGNEDYNVEKLLAAGGEGVLFGGAVGGAAGATVGAFKKVLGRGAAEVLEEAADEPTKLSFAERRAARAFGIESSDAAQIGAEKLKVFAREALDKNLIPPSVFKAATDDLATKSFKVDKTLKEIGEGIGEHYKQLDDVGAALNKQPVLEAWAKRLGEYRRDRGYEKLVDKIEGSDFFNAVVNKSKTFQALHREDSSLRKLAESMNIDKVEGALINQLRGDLKEGLMKAVEGVSKPHAGAIRELDRLYGAFAEVAPLVASRAERAAFRAAPLTPFDVAIGVGGAAAFSSPVGAVTGGARALAKAAWRSERAESMLARASDNLHKASVQKGRELSNAVEKAASADPVRVPQSISPKFASLAKEYHTRHKAAAESQTNQAATSRRLALELAPLTQVDPVYGRKAVATAVDDLKWLNSKAPQGYGVTEPVKLKGWKGTKAPKAMPDVPASEQAAFVRTSKALADPINEVKFLKSGKWSPELIEVLQDRRPQLRASIEQHFDNQVVKLAEDGKKMSYDMRVTATLTTGKSYDQTLEPDFIKLAQDYWDEKKANAPQIPSAPTPRATPKAARARVGRYKTGAEELFSSGDLA